jgi:aminomethyltransferase
MLARTPLYDRHEAAGARFVPFAGYEMPVQYVGLKQEHLQVRSGVGLFDVSHMGEVFVRGPEAVQALEWLVSNEIGSMTIGQARYGLLCNEQGGVVDDVVVYRLGPTEFLVCVNAANRAKDFAWMTAHNPFPNSVQIVDDSDAWVQIAVQGPKAEATIQPLTSLPLAEMVYYHFAVGAVAGVEGCIVARTGYTGEDGFEVFVPAAQGGVVWDALLAAGAPFGAMPIGLGARDTLRLEVRYPLYGHELGDELSPLQAKLTWPIKLGKPGGFLGAEAIVARRDTDTHFLAGVVMDDSRIAREGMRVLSGGEDVGWVTSGTRAPTVDRGICLCYVRKGLGAPGTQLTFDVRGREATGTVVKGPFYRRDA